MDLVEPKRTLALTVVAVLAVVQSIAAVVRALEWLEVGSDLMGQGLLLLPLLGLIAIGRGMLVAVLALLFVAFACGALLQRRWARWLGVILAIVNLLMVLSLVIQGESLLRALVWAIVPVVMLGYLVSESGHQALRENIGS
jgi:hypothetical protein